MTLTLSSFQAFAFMDFVKSNVLLKLIITELDMDSEASLSADLSLDKKNWKEERHYHTRHDTCCVE